MTTQPTTGNPAAERPDQPLDSFLADAGLAFDDIPVAMAIHRRALLHERRATVERIRAQVMALHPATPTEMFAILDSERMPRTEAGRRLVSGPNMRRAVLSDVLAIEDESAVKWHDCTGNYRRGWEDGRAGRVLDATASEEPTND